MAFELKYGESSLSKKLGGEFPDKLGALILMYASTKASELQSKMQLNRPWTDRTGMAKATMRARVTRPDDKTIRILLSYGVEYGIWLELAHEKNFAIIAPTIREESPRVVEDLNGILSELKL